MPPYVSSPELLTLHAVRLKGVADAGKVAARFGLALAQVDELLLDFQASGWLYRADFAGTGGWALTEAGRRAGEQQLAAELAVAGADDQVRRAHAAFLPWNARFQDAVTRWQVRPAPGDPLAANDHSDLRWDDRVLDALASLGRRLSALTEDLTGALLRFDGYGQRYAAALDRVERGQRSWVDAPGLDSCHAVWFELHEDLLATLGLERGREAAGG